MNAEQEHLINLLQDTRKIYVQMMDIVKQKRPLSHKNASAICNEINAGLRHMSRMQRWIAEEQIEDEEDEIYDRID